MLLSHCQISRSQGNPVGSITWYVGSFHGQIRGVGKSDCAATSGGLWPVHSSIPAHRVWPVHSWIWVLRVRVSCGHTQECRVGPVHGWANA